MSASTGRRTPPRVPPLLPSPPGRPVEVRGVPLETLGGLAVAGMQVQALRLGDVDVLCVARARSAGTAPAFVTTAEAEATYATWPADAPHEPRAVDPERVRGGVAHAE